MSIWAQRTIRLQAHRRGCHDITREVMTSVPEISKTKMGVIHLFLLHTSASITINENCCSDVKSDMERIMNRLVPEKEYYEHSSEGKDDMPAHFKSSMFGVSLSIPVTDGDLHLGTWQGIYLCEHRDYGGSRSMVCTLNGQPGM